MDDGIDIPIISPTFCRIRRNILGVLSLSYIRADSVRGGGGGGD